jgi:type III secretion protein Q
MAPGSETDSVDLVVLVGGQKLSFDELRDLKVQDVVLLDWCSSTTREEIPSAGVAVCGLKAFFTFMNERRGHYFAVLRRGGAAPAYKAVLLVEWTRVSLDEAEARSLSEGSVVDLGPQRKGPLWLQLAGRLLGRCELVEIDGKPGARVVELL